MFTKTRDRPLEGGIARVFLSQAVAQAQGRLLLSSEQFTIDGTMVEAWAGQQRS